MPLEYLYSAMQMENMQVPPPSRWFHLHYALSLRYLCLCFIDRVHGVLLSLVSRLPCHSWRIFAVHPAWTLRFISSLFGLGVFARIQLAGNNDNEAATTRASFLYGWLLRKVRAVDNSSLKGGRKVFAPFVSSFGRSPGQPGSRLNFNFPIFPARENVIRSDAAAR